MTAVMIEIAFFGIAILVYICKIDRRVSALEARMSSLDGRVSTLAASVSSLDARMYRLEGMFEGYLARQKSSK